MDLDRLRVPDARIVQVECDALFRGYLPPDFQRVLHEAGRGIAHFGRITRTPGMAFAVTLDVIGLDLLDDILYHLAVHAFSDFFAIITGVKVEMHT